MTFRIIAVIFTTVITCNGFAATDSENLSYEVVKLNEFSKESTETVICVLKVFGSNTVASEFPLRCTPTGSYCDRIEFGPVTMRPTLDLEVAPETGSLTVQISDDDTGVSVASTSKVTGRPAIHSKVSYSKELVFNGYQASCTYDPTGADSETLEQRSGDTRPKPTTGRKLPVMTPQPASGSGIPVMILQSDTDG